VSLTIFLCCIFIGPLQLCPIVFLPVSLTIFLCRIFIGPRPLCPPISLSFLHVTLRILPVLLSSTQSCHTRNITRFLISDLITALQLLLLFNLFCSQFKNHKCHSHLHRLQNHMEEYRSVSPSRCHKAFQKEEYYCLPNTPHLYW